ncbi:MAG: hypothetical protein AAF228_06725 [Pseudomonadota bacterium]
MTWVRLAFLIARFVNALWEAIQKHRYIRQGEKQAELRALKEQQHRVQQAKAAREKIKRLHNSDALNCGRVRNNDPYRRD